MEMVRSGEAVELKAERHMHSATRSAVNAALEVFSLVLVDLLAFFGIMAIAYQMRLHLLPVFVSGLPQGISPATLLHVSWFPFLAVLSFAFSGLYTRRFPWMQETGMLARGATFSFLIALGTLFILKESSQVSRLFILLTWVNSLWLVPLTRLSAKKCLIGWGLWVRPVIIVGSGQLAERACRALRSDAGIGYRVLGTVLPGENGGSDTRGAVPVLGRWEEIDQVLDRTGVKDVVIAAAGLYSQGLAELVGKLQQRAENVLFVPDIYGLPVLGADIGYFFDQRTLVINFRNNLKNRLNIAAKRVFDLAAGIIITVLAMPLLAGLAAAVAMDSKGPVLYRQKRIGRSGSIFWCYKFRTMVADADSVLMKLLDEDSNLAGEWKQDHKLKKDPRITRVGKLLRKYSLDELPQIINVIRGEMSLVGPRPVVRSEIPKYGGFVDYYFTVRPGISGLWQVSGRNDIDYDTRVMLDSWYVRNWSLWLDIYILIRTVRVVLLGKGAY
ncbi:MAG: undecaprenyl-phosphate galactose phosphotransferase WbaP [Bacillota bacterium]